MSQYYTGPSEFNYIIAIVRHSRTIGTQAGEYVHVTGGYVTGGYGGLPTRGQTWQHLHQFDASPRASSASVTQSPKKSKASTTRYLAQIGRLQQPSTANSASYTPTGNLPMSSKFQINANRSNAQHSTGPKSDAGKAASSQNSFKHGLDDRYVYSYTILISSIL